MDPNNYRGITLLSCIGKLFTAIINSRLTKFLNVRGIIGDEQAGFRNNFSTVDHIFVLKNLVDIYLSKRKKLYCAFVDYCKAFDFVDRTSLWSKIIANGINGKIMTVIYNMYNNAKSRIKLNGQYSNLFDCNIGVRQGENLSPLLFAIYLNDFELYLSQHYNGLNDIKKDIGDRLSDDDVEIFLRLFVLLYADDTIILAESPECLQKGLDALNNYCNLWKLSVNASKTKIVIFSRGKTRRIPEFTFGNTKIDVVDDYTYLGVIFQFNGKFKKAINKQVSQARGAMFSLLTKTSKLNLPIDIVCELFDRLVVPILLYGSEIWGFENINQIEVFYRNFLRRILGVSKYTTNCFLYGEVGKFHLESTIALRMFNFWTKIISGSENKLTFRIYCLSKHLHEDANHPFQSNWISKIKNFLNNCGLCDIWINQNSLDVNWAKNVVESRLHDIDIQKWDTKVFNNSQSISYRIFKTNHRLEPYLVLHSKNTQSFIRLDTLVKIF